MILANEPNNKECRATHSPWQSGAVLLDEYRIEKLLGEGGMGQVYLVVSLSTGYRYALKKCKISREGDRRNFFTELQTWIELPDHPNLVTCRFFRSIQEDIVIFSDFIDGGSLATMIQERRLTLLEDLLDMAIQFAVGLHAIHEHGFIHQDVKPGNVLVNSAKTAKVSDFGLSRARQFLASHKAPAETDRDTLLVPGSGYMTRAYASPEQMSGLPLSRKSDLWSWAVSVLEMFTGEVTWQTGRLAGDALEQYVECGPVGSHLPVMPCSLVELLRKCFVEKPEGRIPTLLHAANTLRDIYREHLGRDYVHGSETLTAVTAPAASFADDMVPWVPPQQWLMIALELHGENPLKAARFLNHAASSLKSRALSDLNAYTEAMNLLDAKLKCPDPSLPCQRACLCIDKASVHVYLGDCPGAIGLFDRALSILTEAPNNHESHGIAIVSAARGKAQLLLRRGFNDESFLLFRQALEACLLLKDVMGKAVVAEIAVSVRLGMAQIERERDRPGAATAIYNEALAEIADMSEEAQSQLRMQCLIGRIQAERDLGDTMSAERDIAAATDLLRESDSPEEYAWARIPLAIHRASLLSSSGASDEAVAVLTEAIAKIEPLSRPRDRIDLREQLAAAQNARASILVSAGGREAALAVYDVLVPDCERFVREDGRSDLAGTLTQILSERALCIHQLGDMASAISAYDKAISILENLASKNDDWRLLSNLATLFMNKANAMGDLHNRREAIVLFDRAISLRQGLAGRMSATTWAKDLAITLTNKSEYVLAEGMQDEAQQLCDGALALLEKARPRYNDRQWSGYVGWVTAHRAEALWTAGHSEEALRTLTMALTSVSSALHECNSPMLRWALKDSEAVAARISRLSGSA